MRKLIPALVSIILVASCTKPARYHVTEYDVTIHLKDQVVRLQPVSEKIIRVSATPGDTLTDPQSLSVTGNAHFKDFQVKEDNDQLLVTTRALRARVSLSSGEVVFTDS